MSEPAALPVPARASIPWKRHVLALAVALVAIAFGWDGIRVSSAPPKAFRDFALMQTAAECFLDRCDPYSAEAATQENAARGELKMPVTSDELMYPPSTFLLFTPLARAGWPRAGFLWCWLGVFLVALTCIVLTEKLELERHLAALLALLALLVSTPLHTITRAPFNNNLHSGNPTLVAAPLIALACLLLLESGLFWPKRSDGLRTTIGWVLLGLALAFKPQLAIGPFAALLLSRATRSSAIKAAVFAMGMFALAAAVLRLRLGSFAFLPMWEANNWFAHQPGRTCDVSMINPLGQDMLQLQRIAYFFGAPKPWPDVFAWVIVACIITAATVVNLRGAWRRGVWCSVALFTLVSVMPVYHNKYDRLIFLALLPAIVELQALGHKAAAWLFAVIGAFWVLSEQIFDHVLGRAEQWPVNQAVPLMLCALLLWAMARRPTDQETMHA